jgi:4-diphosphocytidyl-2-C-methyl-D-erythritol kinase
MLTLKAPAKINLTLEVLRKRPDGFHEVRSVLQAIDLGDVFHISSGEGISFKCDMPGWSAEASLVSRAVGLLREVTGCQKGARINIEKCIPLMSGLGGDSSGAAAVLRGLKKFWGLGLPPEKLRQIAARLGSDVPFFLEGGTVLATGRGEVITPLPSLPEMWVVVVMPDFPVPPGKTGRLYAALKQSYYTDGVITQNLADALHKGLMFHHDMLFNTFENVAFDCFPGLDVYKEHLVKLGAPFVHLAGSGPALFTMFGDKLEAEDLYIRAKDQGMRVYLTHTSTTRVYRENNSIERSDIWPF